MLSQFFVAHRVTAPLLACILAFAAIGARLGVEATRHDIGNDTLYYVSWGEQAHTVGVLHLSDFSVLLLLSGFMPPPD
jgi:hypothetical protein